MVNNQENQVINTSVQINKNTDQKVKPIEIAMYAIAISLNLIILICGYLIIYQGIKFGVYTVIFQIALTIGALIFTFTALLLTIVGKNKKTLSK